MAALQVAETLDYLNDAAHLMLTAAPETSTHLMSVRNGLSSHNGITATEAQRQHVCSACGHILIPGDADGSNISLRTLGKRKSRGRPGQPLQKPRAQATPATGPTKVVHCGLCSRQTSIDFARPGRASRRKTVKSSNVAKKQLPDLREALKPTATANASSKKRAKTRKAGLQALLSGQQSASKPLSLADFTRK